MGPWALAGIYIREAETMQQSTQHIAKMYEQLSEREQTLITELIACLLPDDVATPEDITAIAKSQAEYKRGNIVRMEDIDWN